MAFIEIHPNEDQARLAELIRSAYISLYGEEPAALHLGRVIAWQDRVFQQLETLDLEYEERLFKTWKLSRARVQVGSVVGEVFTTPAQANGEPAARIKEADRCGREYLVKPFYYSDYGPLA